VTQVLGQLGKNRDGDLGRRAGADVQSHGAVEPCQRSLVEAGRGQSFEALPMGTPAAETADVEGIGIQGRRQRRIVQLRIMGQGDDRTAGVQMLAIQAVVGPGVEHT